MKVGTAGHFEWFRKVRRYQIPVLYSIFFHNKGLQTAAMKSSDRLMGLKKSRNHSILTEILPLQIFWPAGGCHQQFSEKCGQGYCTTRQIHG
jgi:peptide methionine sulfoxide reductase MsrA